jgi:hypothetical protein
VGQLSPQAQAFSGCGWSYSPQLWRVAANILNKPTGSCHVAGEFGVRLTNILNKPTGSCHVAGELGMRLTNILNKPTGSWHVAGELGVRLTNILNKPTGSCHVAGELGVRLTNLHRKNKLVTKCYIEPRTWTDSLNKVPQLRNANET